jgi:hypothetical protein
VIVRVASGGPGRLVRIRLGDVPYIVRERAAARERNTIARTMNGVEAVDQAVAVTRAAMFPDDDRTYLLSEEAVIAAIGYVPTGDMRRYRHSEGGLPIPDGVEDGDG